MTSCYCDDEAPPIFYRMKTHVAKVEHRCDECHGTISKGQSYERVSGMWADQFDEFKTCQNCINLRDFVKAHVPCMCWSHGSMREEAIETAIEFSGKAPGLLFGALRREVLIRKAKSALNVVSK